MVDDQIIGICVFFFWCIISIDDFTDIFKTKENLILISLILYTELETDESKS